MAAPAEDDPNVSDYDAEYENKQQFFHNSAAAPSGRPTNYAAGSLLLTLVTLTTSVTRLLCR